MRRDPSSEGASHTGGKASWLVPEGLHSCGTAPDLHRTSLLATDGTFMVSGSTGHAQLSLLSTSSRISLHWLACSADRSYCWRP